MKVNVYYLNLENGDRNTQAYERFCMGFKEGDKANLEWYRSHIYDLKSIDLEDIFYELNASDRFNGQKERGLSVGDIVELKGKLYGVNTIGFFYLGVAEEKDKKILISSKIDLISKLMKEVNEMWEDVTDTTFLDEEYPFESSFDEVVLKVSEWKHSVKEQLGLD